MAGDWLKMRTNLWTDPRIVKLEAQLAGTALWPAGAPWRAAVIGGLFRLWSIADSHTADGRLPGYTLEAIDRETGIDGFAEALVRIGWLGMVEDGVCVIRFSEHNGQSAKARAGERVRKRLSRSPAPAASGKCPENVRTLSAECPDQRREEKTREEKTPEKARAIGQPDFVSSSDRFILQPLVSEAWEALPPRARQGKIRFGTVFCEHVTQRGIDPQKILAGLKAYYSSPQGTGPHFLLPHNWIDRGCYDDPPEAWQDRSGSRDWVDQLKGAKP